MTSSSREDIVYVLNTIDTIFTCFLEYESHTVKVHDLAYYRDGNGWQLNKSYYRKLGLSQQWIEDRLEDTGFSQIELHNNRGLVTVIATK